MKDRIFFLLATTMLIISCGPNSKEKAIMDYEQTTEGIKTDLSIKIISSEKIGILTFNDSAAIYKGIFKKDVDRAITESETRYFKYKREVIESMYSLAVARLPQSIKHYRETIDMYNNLAKSDSIYAEKLKAGDYSNPDFSNKFILLRRYEASPDSLIAEKYLTNYSIKNPLLNGVKQELKKEHWITPLNKVIYSVKKTE